MVFGWNKKNRAGEKDDALAERWNRPGRDYARRINGFIADQRAGRAVPDDWPGDSRDLDLAGKVIGQVERLHREGQYGAARNLFDPAHEPFIPLLDEAGQNLSCAVILGPDDYLVRLGSSYRPGPTLRITGNETVELPEILAAATSRDHELLLLVRARGFAISRGFDGAVVAELPWPEGTEPGALDDIHISEDGLRIAFCQDDAHVWLGHVLPDGGAHWDRVYPDDAFLAERREEDDDPDEDEADGGWSDSMMHCALSPDGCFIAYGSQCYGHYIDAIDGPGRVRRWATLGYISEYPHNACFSDDGGFVALNSCHFYHGRTLGARIAAVEGIVTEPYQETDLTKEIDGALRVYASAWLPADVAGHASGAFALAGAGYLNIVTPDGEILARQCFGSSASSIDYCPKSKQLLLGSYSGFLHVYDIAENEEADLAIGDRPRRERSRWVLWKDRPPFRW